MRLALISDIHANRQAVDALRRDLEEQRVDSVVCLGDIVGYGPEPQYALDQIRALTSNIVIGNHDAVIAGRMNPALFNDNARRIIEWTATQLDSEAASYFAGAPEMIASDDLLFVHAESADPLRFDYIIEPEDTFASFQARKEKITFIGHTHHAGVFQYSIHDGLVEKRRPVDFTIQPDTRYIVNVGSVGEPRDQEIRGSYVIHDLRTGEVRFRRIPIDVPAYLEDLHRRQLGIEPHFVKVYHYLRSLESAAHGSSAKPAELVPAEIRVMRPTASSQAKPQHTVQIQHGLQKPMPALAGSTLRPPTTRLHGSAAPAAHPTPEPGGRKALITLLIVLLLGGFGYGGWTLYSLIQERRQIEAAPKEKRGPALPDNI